MVNTILPTKVDISKAYEDNFRLLCLDEEDFISALIALGANRETAMVKVNGIVFKAMVTPLESPEFSEDVDSTAISAYYDTLENGTKVYVEIEGLPHLLRNTALASIFERLRIGGEVLNDLSGEMLAEHLNHYATFAGNEGLAIFNNGKLEAVLSKKYTLVPAEDVMRTASEYFATGDIPAKFVAGCYSHNFVDAMWKTGECFVETPFDVGLGDTPFEQSVVVSTSDCGLKAITVSPKMRQKGDKYGLEYCLPLKLEHYGGASVAEFEKNLKLIDKRFQDASERISEMAQTALNHPANVVLAMFKWLKIPAKYGAQVYERRKLMWEGLEKSAYDVYASLSEVLSLIVGEEESTRDLALYQERFSRALRFNFRSYDLPGEYGYQDKLIGARGA